jgi:hypothetical protein
MSNKVVWETFRLMKSKAVLQKGVVEDISVSFG